MQWKKQNCLFPDESLGLIKIFSNLLLNVFKDNFIQNVIKCVHKHTLIYRCGLDILKDYISPDK